MRTVWIATILLSLGTEAMASDAPPAPRPADQQQDNIDPRYTCELGRVGVFVISTREAARVVKLPAAAATPPVRGIC